LLLEELGPIVVFVGPKGSGKSSLIGRILLEANIVSREDEEEARAVAKLLNRDSYYSLLVDETLSERKHGFTQVMKLIGPIKLFDRSIRLVDTPGDFKYFRDIMAALCIADKLFITLQPGARDEIEPFLHIAKALEVEDVVIVLNKQDLSTIPTNGLLHDLTIIPASALKGFNIDCILDEIAKAKFKRRSTEPTRMPIIKVIGDLGIAIGVITQGSMRIHEQVLIAPEYKVGEIEVIEVHGRKVEIAHAGYDIGLSMKGVGRQYIKRGYLIGDLKKPPIRASTMRCSLLWSRELREGMNVIVNVHASQAQCKIARVLADMVELKVLSPPYLPVDERLRETSVLVLRTNKNIVGVGICEEVNP